MERLNRMRGLPLNGRLMAMPPEPSPQPLIAVFSSSQTQPLVTSHPQADSPIVHSHTTIGPSKLCQGCGQKLSGAEVRAVRERQAKAAKRPHYATRSPWEQAAYPTRQEEIRNYEARMKRAGARGA